MKFYARESGEDWLYRNRKVNLPDIRFNPTVKYKCSLPLLFQLDYYSFRKIQNNNFKGENTATYVRETESRDID